MTRYTPGQTDDDEMPDPEDETVPGRACPPSRPAGGSRRECSGKARRNTHRILIEAAAAAGVIGVVAFIATSILPRTTPASLEQQPAARDARRSWREALATSREEPAAILADLEREIDSLSASFSPATAEEAARNYNRLHSIPTARGARRNALPPEYARRMDAALSALVLSATNHVNRLRMTTDLAGLRELSRAAPTLANLPAVRRAVLAAARDVEATIVEHEWWHGADSLETRISGLEATNAATEIAQISKQLSELEQGINDNFKEARLGAIKDSVSNRCIAVASEIHQTAAKAYGADRLTEGDVSSRSLSDFKALVPACFGGNVIGELVTGIESKRADAEKRIEAALPLPPPLVENGESLAALSNVEKAWKRDPKDIPALEAAFAAPAPEFALRANAERYEAVRRQWTDFLMEQQQNEIRKEEKAVADYLRWSYQVGDPEVGTYRRDTEPMPDMSFVNDLQAQLEKMRQQEAAPESPQQYCRRAHTMYAPRVSSLDSLRDLAKASSNGAINQYDIRLALYAAYYTWQNAITAEYEYAFEVNNCLATILNAPGEDAMAFLSRRAGEEKPQESGEHPCLYMIEALSFMPGLAQGSDIRRLASEWLETNGTNQVVAARRAQISQSVDLLKSLLKVRE